MSGGRKVFVRLSGGLGNQLFQLAAATLVARGNMALLQIITDALNNYQTPRSPDALRLLRIAPWSPRRAAVIGHGVHWLVSVARAGRWLPLFGVGDDNLWPQLDSRSTRSIALVDGYFQQGWSIDRLASAVTAWQLEPSQANGRCDEGECVVHIRGGDFNALPNYQVANAEYYGKAIQLALSSGLSRFAVITDDVSYSNQLLRDIEIAHQHKIEIRVVPTAQDILDDFSTIRHARARIIGNSTFAWWAVALDEKQRQTWSPTRFTLDRMRDHFLPWESPIKVM